MPVSSMNDRWSRIAATAQEKPARVARPVALTSPQTAPQSALEIAGLTAADVQRLTAKHRTQHVAAADKRGIEATALDRMISVWVEVTPTMAARWLKSNFRNRPVAEDVVKAYARDMATQRWMPTHQGIAFNEQDQLIDGQHRLHAIIKCGLTVRMMVTFGLPVQIAGTEMTTMDCVDRGRTRTVADQLKIQHGFKQGTVIASVTASLAFLCVGERVRRLSVGQTLDIYRLFQPAMEWILAARSKEAGLKSAGVLAAFVFAHTVTGDEQQRLDRLNTGRDVDSSPAIRLLRELLTGAQSSMLVQSMNRGLAEMATWVLWADRFAPAVTTLEARPEEWLKAVQHFRDLQPERVKRVQALFQLPGGAGK